MADSGTYTMAIQTPEGVRFSLSLAGPATRFLAWLIDLFVIVALYSLLSYAVQVFALISYDWARAFGVVLFFVLTIGYPIVLEWAWRGQSVGKWLLRLQVMDVHGLRLHFTQIAVRNLLRFVDALPFFYLVGGVACLVSRHGQRLGDLAANTVVVRRPNLATPDLDQLLADKYNSFRAHPHIEARLRQRVTPEEARLATQALVRREQLDPEARVHVFAEIADHFRTLAAFPEEATYGMTDEQYVRNVVDVVFRTHGTKGGQQP
jgi:uncharacterized RDD family membrane protein YckC